MNIDHRPLDPGTWAGLLLGVPPPPQAPPFAFATQPAMHEKEKIDVPGPSPILLGYAPVPIID